MLAFIFVHVQPSTPAKTASTLIRVAVARLGWMSNTADGRIEALPQSNVWLNPPAPLSLRKANDGHLPRILLGNARVWLSSIIAGYDPGFTEWRLLSGSSRGLNARPREQDHPWPFRAPPEFPSVPVGNSTSADPIKKKQQRVGDSAFPPRGASINPAWPDPTASSPKRLHRPLYRGETTAFGHFAPSAASYRR